jgi:hypothetical protein
MTSLRLLSIFELQLAWQGPPVIIDFSGLLKVMAKSRRPNGFNDKENRSVECLWYAEETVISPSLMKSRQNMAQVQLANLFE